MSGSYYPQYPPRPSSHQQVYQPPPSYFPPQTSRQPPATYTLRIEQGPERAKLVTKDKIKDRKPIDPPPIIRCVHSDPLNSASAYNPYLFCCVTLYDEEQDEPKKADGSLSLLVGATVSSAHRLKGLNNDEGTFFVFGDLAPCCPGPARLHFALYELKDSDTRALASITSTPFDVSSAKEWDGVKESTVLSRTFADQGVKLRLKKESRNGRRGVPPNQYTLPPTSQSQLLPQLQPQPQYQPHPHHLYPPQHHTHSTASWDEEDEGDGRGAKRQRLSYAGSAYSGYTSSTQTPLHSYQSYPSQDPSSYAYNLAYQPRSSQGGQQTPPQSYSQSPAQHYSPQQLAQYRRQPSYYPPQPQAQPQPPQPQQPQTSQYSGYPVPASTGYAAQAYAPVDNPQQSFENHSQQPYGQSQQAQLTLPPMRQAPPADPQHYPPPTGST